jgi:hypothetical protein
MGDERNSPGAFMGKGQMAIAKHTEPLYRLSSGETYRHSREMVA